MEDAILALTDEKAEAVLVAMTQPLARGGQYETGWTPELGRALGEAFGVDPASAGTATGGDVARQALLLLAQDPDPARRSALAALIQGATPRSFSIGLDAAAVAGVLIALQTHVRVKGTRKGGDGETSWLIEKKPTSDVLLKPLVQKLLAWYSMLRG